MIKFLVMDVDGTMTDGKIYLSDRGELFKVFDVKDGCGIKDILPNCGIIPVIITARNSKILESRCKELNIKHLYQGIREKKRKLDDIISNYNFEFGTAYTYENVAYIGDDILDLQCMIPVEAEGGITGCPQNAIEEVRRISKYVCLKRGGDGAIREFIEYLKTQNYNG